MTTLQLSSAGAAAPQSKAASLHSVELFTGAGGLALGISQAGFQHTAVVERDRDACESLRLNASRVAGMSEWPIFECDANTFDFEPFASRVALLAAGVPCQPFSQGGKHQGHRDVRNLFPIVFKGVAKARPLAVLIENVKGLTRLSFSSYLEYVKARIRFPHIPREAGESWKSHLKRLGKVNPQLVPAIERYTVGHVVLNAADFGLPQKRERVFIIGFRADTEVDWAQAFLPLMSPRYSEDALLYDKWVNGAYWERHGVRRLKPPPSLERRIASLRAAGQQPDLPRWKTVRDGLRSHDDSMGWSPLPAPSDRHEAESFSNHLSNPGARSYPGHTGSEWDSPAKTLKAGYHGVPGGENTLRLPGGRVRYFTVREAARLQGFPDSFKFEGAWCQAFRQIGNSVPVPLARHVATSIAKVLQPRPGKS
jgi:DNA (cytosine-5)-methyltransferase 1